jgi:hypothetical protein
MYLLQLVNIVRIVNFTNLADDLYVVDHTRYSFRIERNGERWVDTVLFRQAIIAKHYDAAFVKFVFGTVNMEFVWVERLAPITEGASVFQLYCAFINPCIGVARDERYSLRAARRLLRPIENVRSALWRVAFR